ncbi:MAG: riboflavin biosynthesis protein RibF [Coprobacillaceae bacterium]
MEILYVNSNQKIKLENNCMALGYFDGLHLGHLSLLKEVKKIAKENNIKSSLMTFDKHPKELFADAKYPYLTTLDDKIKLLKELEFDYLIIVHFNEEFSKVLPEEFIQEYIVNLNVQHVVCGFDYHFGRFGKGNIDVLEQNATKYEVTVMSQKMYQDYKISSTYIKELLHQGNISLVNELLQRNYCITGEVIHGYQRGKKELGFATANVAYENYVTPEIGVYATKVIISDKVYYGMTSIGYNPTFGDLQKPSLEVHIFDFDEDIYGEIISVEFVMLLRGEIRFTSKEALIEQLHKDQIDIQEYFKENV